MTLLLPLLVSVIAGSAQPVSSSADGDRPAAYALDSLYFQQAGLLDRVCIVQAKGQSRETRSAGNLEPGDQGAFARAVSIEEGMVVDGPGKGGIVRLVAFDPPDDAQAPIPSAGGLSGGGVLRRPAFVVGGRYLALAIGSIDHRLVQPASLAEARYPKEGAYVRSTRADEASLLAAFPTDATALPDAKDPASRLVGALVDAIPAVRGWDRERLIYFLSNSHGLGYDRLTPHPEDAVTRRVQATAQAATDPTVRIAAYTVLVNWGILGSESSLFTALMDAADSPEPIRDLPDQPLSAYSGDGAPEGYRIAYDRARANKLAASGRNDTVRRYLFEFTASAPTIADKKLYVRNLGLEPREFVDRVMLRRLADWDAEADKKPILVNLPGKGQEARGRDELIAYWKAKYKG